MLDGVTTPLDEDVAVSDGIEDEVISTDEHQVDTSGDTPEVETNDEDYAKAWDSIDTENPSDGLFSEEADEDVPNDLEDQQVDNSTPNDVTTQTGLMITNPILKYKGREIPIDNEEEAINLMQKGFKLESEMTKIKPYKQMIAIMDNSSITTEDLKAFTDALDGNEGAKTYIQGKLGLQSTSEASSSFFDEVDEKKTVDEYKPDIPKSDAVAEYFKTVTENSPEVAGKVSQVYADIEDEFKNEVYNPEEFPMFVSSIANGEFDEYYPMAIKIRLGNPSYSWLQAYQLAGQRVKDGTQETQTAVPPKGTSIPKVTAGKPRGNGSDYDRAFSMDTRELEEKLFG